MEFDIIDKALLQALQRDATTANTDLAKAAKVSPATALRRVQRLKEEGVIERSVALLNPERVAAIQGAGLTALVEINLDRQDASALDAFERRAVTEDAVQQCYRVSPGPDFMLVLHVADMPTYHALAQRLFAADANVRNVKTFFSVHRAKFEPRIELL